MQEITLTIAQIIGLAKGLNDIRQYDVSLSMAWDLDDNIRKTGEVVTTFNKMRDDVLASHARKDDAGKPIAIDGRYDIPQDKVHQVTAEMQELLDKPLDISLVVFTYSQVKKELADAKISAEQIGLLKPIINRNGEVQEPKIIKPPQEGE